MAETKDFRPESAKPNQTMQHEKAKAEVSGKQRQDERDELDQERHKKPGIIGTSGEVTSQTGSQAGQPGRARNELDQQKKEPAGQK